MHSLVAFHRKANMLSMLSPITYIAPMGVVHPVSCETQWTSSSPCFDAQWSPIPFPSIARSSALTGLSVHSTACRTCRTSHPV